jgi:broad specificity phosphatase PhoE
MPTVTIIRHAQSIFNAGQYSTEEELNNCRLTKLGCESCRELDFSFDLLIISPLKRALETYVNSKIKTKKIMVHDLFRESLDTLSGLNFLENEERVTETSQQLHERINQAVNFLNQLKDENIGIITHGVFAWHLTQKLTGKGIPFNNAGHVTVKI